MRSCATFWGCSRHRLRSRALAAEPAVLLCTEITGGPSLGLVRGLLSVARNSTNDDTTRLLLTHESALSTS